jgi:hypothetical protein
MTRRAPTFANNMLFVITATLLAVMSIAFVSIPFSLGSHPGEVVALAGTTFHPC